MQCIGSCEFKFKFCNLSRFTNVLNECEEKILPELDKSNVVLGCKGNEHCVEFWFAGLSGFVVKKGPSNKS